MKWDRFLEKLSFLFNSPAALDPSIYILTSFLTIDFFLPLLIVFLVDFLAGREGSLLLCIESVSGLLEASGEKTYRLKHPCSFLDICRKVPLHGGIYRIHKYKHCCSNTCRSRFVDFHMVAWGLKYVSAIGRSFVFNCSEKLYWFFPILIKSIFFMVG